MKIIKFSRKRENDIADDTGGKRHARSGGLWWKKGDASTVDFLFEDKFTGKEYYSVTALVLQKIEKEAMTIGKLPIFRIGFISRYGNADYVILRFKDCNIDPIEYTKIPLEISKNKSIRLSSDRLRGLQITGDKFVMRFWLIEKEYIIMNWYFFVSIKHKIIVGEQL
jgi:hypothetical protein